MFTASGRRKNNPLVMERRDSLRPVLYAYVVVRQWSTGRWPAARHCVALRDRSGSVDILRGRLQIDLHRPALRHLWKQSGPRRGHAGGRQSHPSTLPTSRMRRRLPSLSIRWKPSTCPPAANSPSWAATRQPDLPGNVVSHYHQRQLTVLRRDHGSRRTTARRFDAYRRISVATTTRVIDHGSRVCWTAVSAAKRRCGRRRTTPVPAFVSPTTCRRAGGTVEPLVEFPVNCGRW